MASIAAAPSSGGVSRTMNGKNGYPSSSNSLQSHKQQQQKEEDKQQPKLSTVSSSPGQFMSSSLSSSSYKSMNNINYEVFAPRSTSQRSRLSRLEKLTASPAASNQSKDQGSTNTSTATLTLIDAMSMSSYQKHEPTSSSSSSSKTRENTEILTSLQTARSTSQHLHSLIENSTAVQSALSKTLQLTKDISSRHESLLQHSSELSLAAERLQSESEALTKHASEIGLPLQHYDAVDRLGVMVGVLFKNHTTVRGIARVKVDSNEEFTAVLHEIDAAVSFFRERSAIALQEDADLRKLHERRRREKHDPNDPMAQFQNRTTVSSGSVEYYRRSLILQEAALDLIKEAIVDRITQTTKDVTSALDLKRKAVTGDKLEASLVYTRFHGISSRSYRLLRIVRERMDSHHQDSTSNTNANNNVYADMWKLCRNTYVQSREALLRYSVREHLDSLKERHGLVGMTRLASFFLMRLCTVETALYLDFFGLRTGDADTNGDKDINDNDNSFHDQEIGAETDTSNTIAAPNKAEAAALASQVMSANGTYYDADFQAFLDNLCSNLHRTVRRGLVTVLDLDTLCQIVSVLREERSLANASPTTMAAARSISTVIVDAQERLIFCANAQLNKEVVKFKATPVDLDYPDKLRRTWDELQQAAAAANTENDTTAQQTQGATPTTSTFAPNKNASELALETQLKIYESWFPPMRSVLKVLSKIFRVVEPRVFEDIALTSVQSCTSSLKEGSLYIEKKSGVLHADLFLVKHLLILREQLSPFDIQLRSVERQLDFSDAGKAVTRFLANRNRRLFSMSTENALVTLLREGVSVRDSNIDSKRDLEDALRSACNDFIEHTSISLAGPILMFVDQCKSATAASGSSTTAPLSAQSFMNAEYVRAVFNRSLDRLEPELGEVTTQMGLYMENTATQSILLRPVVRKIMRCLEEAKRFISDGSSSSTDGDGEGGWNDAFRKEIDQLMLDIETLVKSAGPRVGKD